TEELAAGVRIRGLRKRYGDTVALDGLDLDARPGEILGIAGPNGAGKSTMVKILAGEVDRDEGEILVDGQPWSSDYGSNRVAVIVDGRCVRLLEGPDRTPENIAETLVLGLGTTPAGETQASANGASADDLGLELVGVTDQKQAFQSLDVAAPKGTVTALIGV